MRPALILLPLLAACSTGEDSVAEDTGLDTDTGVDSRACPDPSEDTAALAAGYASAYCGWLRHCVLQMNPDTAEAESHYQSCWSSLSTTCIDPCDTSAQACIDGIDMEAQCPTYEELLANTPDACFTVIDCE